MLFLAAIVSMMACVPCLNPLFTEKELVLDEAILGSWVDEEHASWVFEQSTEDSYLLTYHPLEAGWPLSSVPGNPVRFEARLVRLGDDLFLDLFPDAYPDSQALGNDLALFHLVPAHTFSRIWIDQEGIKLGMLDPEWLERGLAAGEIEIAHKRGEEGVLLTAATSELQAFARTFADNKEAFGVITQLVRVEEQQPEVRHTAEAGIDLLSEDLVQQIDQAVEEVVEETGVPSASVAVVRDGEIVLTRAYGLAHLEPETPATPSMRYPIGSISKQFIATAVAMLAKEGKLDLDAQISRFYPEVTGAEEITLRQLLSHTSGIRDYWPQDYVPPVMLEPTTTDKIISQHASQPLDFEPGTQYQYSNTGYTIAGAIVEKVSGSTLMDFLTARIFKPLGMETVFDIDTGPLPPEDAAGFQRFGLGPLRDAPKEGAGWLFSAGQLAMSAEDLSRWNVALMEGKLPGADVLTQISQEVVLDSGVGSGYALGVGVALENGRRRVRHGGEVSGYTARSQLYPEEGVAVVVLVNLDAVGAAGTIAGEVTKILFADALSDDAEMNDRVAEVLAGLRQGKIDRSWFTANGNAYFSETALTDIKESLADLGEPESIELESRGLRGGFITRIYSAEFEDKTLEIVTRARGDGVLEQYTISVE